MTALSIALKDLQILFKDRGAVIQLFLLPLVFIAVFSGALSAIGKGNEDDRIPVPVVDLDGGEQAQVLLAGLDAAGGVRVERHEQVEAMALLDEKEVTRVLIIPSDFTVGIAEGRTVTLRLVNHPNADPQEAEAVRLVVDGVARDMGLENQILASLQQMADMQANAPEEYREVFGMERMMTQARSQFERAQTQPLVAVEQRVPGNEESQEDMLDLDRVAVPGFAVLFIFLTAQATARSIYDEKKVGSFRRLLAAPMSKATLFIGKMLPNFLTGLIQATIIFAFSTLGLRLLGLTPVPLGNSPLAVVIVVAITALCSTALGLVIAALARTENQIGGLSSVLLWGLGILGGAFIPLFLLERFLGPIPKFIPQYWANRALSDLMIRGLALSDVVLELAVLFGFTALFFVIGLWRFDFD